MISEIEAKPLDLRVKCEPDETNSESDDAEDIKPIYKGYKKCIIKQFRKFCTTRRSYCSRLYSIIVLYLLFVKYTGKRRLHISRVKSSNFTCYPSISED